MFWLDGHWCLNAGGKENECPLLQELKAIKTLQDAIVLIDDARCFMGPLSAPHKSKDWPRIDEIFRLSFELFPKHTITIIDDVIIIAPQDVKHIVDAYWEDTITDRFGYLHQPWRKFTKLELLKYAIGIKAEPQPKSKYT